MQEFEWDDKKERGNWHDHGVRFDLATQVFRDPHRTVEPDFYESEDRLRTIGMTQDGCMLVVVCTYRGDTIRIISARHAEPRERMHYGNREV